MQKYNNNTNDNNNNNNMNNMNKIKSDAIFYFLVSICPFVFLPVQA